MKTNKKYIWLKRFIWQTHQSTPSSNVKKHAGRLVAAAKVLNWLNLLVITVLLTLFSGKESTETFYIFLCEGRQSTVHTLNSKLQYTISFTVPLIPVWSVWNLGSYHSNCAHIHSASSSNAPRYWYPMPHSRKTKERILHHAPFQFGQTAPHTTGFAFSSPHTTSQSPQTLPPGGAFKTSKATTSKDH